MFGSLISMTLGLDTATQVSKIIKLRQRRVPDIHKFTYRLAI
jgi:hypothetical protein